MSGREARATTRRTTFKYRLKPTAEQERQLERVLLLCRRRDTVALEQRVTAWQRGHVSVSRFQQEAELKAMRTEFPEYASVHSHVLHDVLARLDRTYQAFFRRVQRGEQAGLPRCTGSERYHSCTYTEYSNGARLENGCLVLAKIGRRAVRGSRPLEGTPKTVTVTHAAAGWYVTCSGAEVLLKALPLSDEETGIDLGVASCATLADGSPIATPRSLRVAARTRKRAQRRVSRRQHGSRRRRKAVRLLARAHQRARRARADLHHKMALALVRQYATLSHAALQPANMVKNHSLAKRIGAAGWSGFLSILSCQAGEAGKTVIAVPAPFTAHACSGCGVIVQKALSVRWHLCPVGGMSRQRDHTAALNILRLGPGQSGLGQSPQASTWPGGARVA